MCPWKKMINGINNNNYIIFKKKPEMDHNIDLLKGIANYLHWASSLVFFSISALVRGPVSHFNFFSNLRRLLLSDSFLLSSASLAGSTSFKRCFQAACLEDIFDPLKVKHFSAIV